MKNTDTKQPTFLDRLIVVHVVLEVFENASDRVQREFVVFPFLLLVRLTEAAQLLRLLLLVVVQQQLVFGVYLGHQLLVGHQQIVQNANGPQTSRWTAERIKTN